MLFSEIESENAVGVCLSDVLLEILLDLCWTIQINKSLTDLEVEGR